MTILGVDLGTTNSLAVVYKEGKPVLIPNTFGEYITPSAISILDGKIVVGKSAKERLITHPDQEIESVSYEQNIEIKQDIKTEPISMKEDEIAPPPVFKVETLFVQNEKDVVVYQDILNSIEKSLPKKIGSKEIIDVFTDFKVMPYLEDELFCRRLEHIFLSRKLKYIKNSRDPVYIYLGKYVMSKLSSAMDYSNLPYYKRPAFVAYIVMGVILLELILGIIK